MLIVVALGGNALLKPGQPLTIENQRNNVKIAVQSIAEIIAAGCQVVITHGNGPQVSLLERQGVTCQPEEAYPLDVLGAETDGLIGYLIEQELENALSNELQVAMLLSQIEVDPKDTEFDTPSKPVGPVLTKDEAESLAKKRSWNIAAEGDNYRRVVPSPKPISIPDLRVIKILLEHNITVICAGGGGIPFTRQPDGTSIGVEAVIDKDKASALLAKKLDAHMLLMLTDVEAVYQNWGNADQKPIEQSTVAELSKSSFEKESMQPKIDAACDFISATGGKVGIGNLQDALEIVKGNAGTIIT